MPAKKKTAKKKAKRKSEAVLYVDESRVGPEERPKLDGPFPTKVGPITRMAHFDAAEGIAYYHDGMVRTTSAAYIDVDEEGKKSLILGIKPADEPVADLAPEGDLDAYPSEEVN